MSQWIRQSTASTLVLGPFVDSTDGVTAETGLTIAQADIRLSKNGGAFAQTNNTAGATHMENGHYSVPLDTTDTNTLGRLRVAVNETGALPVWLDVMVVPANEYDSLILGTDALDVEVASMAANVMTAAAAAADLTTELQNGLATSAEIAALDTVVDRVEADTQDLQTQIGTAGAGLTALGDTRIANLDATVSSRLATAGYTTPPTGVENADALLGRSIAGGANGGRTVTSTLRKIRNRVAIAAGTMTVYQEDDTTSDHTAAVTTSAGNPISEVDPT